MAGHSKWANIKHKKAAQDAKRGKVFSAITKKITTAARHGGGDLDTNSELRLYVQKARAANMPSANIERAILKATGQLPGQSFETFTYEGYGPGGVAFYLECSSDNRNRTASNVRYAFSKNGGNLGANGCVGWMFHTKGILSLSKTDVEDVDALMDLALENGAEDFEIEDGSVTITTAREDFIGLRDALVAQGFENFLTDEITMIAENSVEPDLDTVRANMRLIEILEDDDDVESVSHNMELSDEVAEVLGAED